MLFLEGRYRIRAGEFEICSSSSSSSSSSSKGMCESWDEKIWDDSICMNFWSLCYFLVWNGSRVFLKGGGSVERD